MIPEYLRRAVMEHIFDLHQRVEWHRGQIENLKEKIREYSEYLGVEPENENKMINENENPQTS